MIKLLHSKQAEGYVDVVVIVLVIMLFVALAVNVFPVFIAKHQLDTFATELVREAEISGRIGSETTAKANQLRENMGINPTVSWSRTGNLQIDTEVTLTLTLRYDIVKRVVCALLVSIQFLIPKPPAVDTDIPVGNIIDALLKFTDKFCRAIIFIALDSFIYEHRHTTIEP